jgi:hypothetical protein
MSCRRDASIDFEQETGRFFERPAFRLINFVARKSITYVAARDYEF